MPHVMSLIQLKVVVRCGIKILKENVMFVFMMKLLLLIIKDSIFNQQQENALDTKKDAPNLILLQKNVKDALLI